MHATDGHADNLEPGFNALEDGPADDGDPRLDALVEEFLKAQDDCRGDAEELHARVRALVARCPDELHGEFVPFLLSEGIDAGLLDEPLAAGTELTLTTRLRIEREYASGGMARVYLAHDRDLGRTVALKVARKIVDGAWHDDAAARERFLREATMTAGIGHPAIPPVHAVGRGESPRAPVCFALKLIPEDAAFEEAIAEVHRGSARDRGFATSRSRQLLRHVASVCAAVAEVHDKGFVHRDLKPANLALDRRYETIAVLDWGFARERNEAVVGAVEIVGTPAYMSPEQASGQNDRVGPASDVYALGAILYHVLTSRPPFGGAGGDSDATAVLHQVVARDALRAPRKLNRHVPRRLERICVKAMAAEPEGRFPTAAVLADELRRWQDDEAPARVAEPIVERGWRLAVKKYPERTAACALTAAVLVGGGLAARGAIARVEARERGDALGTYRFISDEVLAVPAGLGRETGMVEVLDRAAAKVKGKVGGEPVVEANVRAMLANTYYRLGEYAKAEVQARRTLAVRDRELGHGHHGAAAAESNLASILLAEGQRDEAERLMRHSVEDWRRAAPHDAQEYFIALSNLGTLVQSRGRAAEAQPLVTEGAEGLRRVAGPAATATLSAVNNLGMNHLLRQDPAGAEAVFAPNLEAATEALGATDPITLTAANNLAAARLQQGTYPGDAAALAGNLEATERVLGKFHEYTLVPLTNLMLWHVMKQEWAATAPYMKRRWEVLTRTRGEGDAETLDALMNYAKLLQEQGRHQEAEPLFRGLLRRYQAAVPEDAGRVTSALAGLGWALLETGRAAEAEPLLREVCARRERDPAAGPKHWMTAQARSLLGGALTAQHREPEAEPLLVESYPLIAAAVTAGEAAASREQAALQRIITLYEQWKKPAEAAAWRARRTPGTP